VKRKPKLPPLPKSIATPFGPLAIHVVPADKLPSGTEGSGGCYDSRSFGIYVAADLALVVQWQVYWHERVHMICDLYGLQLSKSQEESVCTAIATDMVAGMVR